MNGKVFPSEYDHAKPLPKRSVDVCGKKGKLARGVRFVSGQNAALVQYYVPRAGDGFSIRVTFLDNPRRKRISRRISRD